MGYGFSYKCKKCGKEGEVYLDVGMRYPQICETAKKEALQGKYGNDAKQAVSDNPEGIFDMTSVIYKCSCGYWREDVKGLYCIPKKSVDAADCYHEWNGRNANVIWRKAHPCPTCGKEMRRYRGDEMALKCPDCGGDIETGGYLMWD